MPWAVTNTWAKLRYRLPLETDSNVKIIVMLGEIGSLSELEVAIMTKRKLLQNQLLASVWE